MDESTWKMIQIMAAFMSVQTAILTGAIGFMWSHFNKRFEILENRMEKLSDKVEDVDRRLCRIEGSLATQGHCLFHQSQSEKKAE